MAQKEPKNVKEADQDYKCIMKMQKELNEFERCDVWELMEPPKDASNIDTKWVFKNKVNEFGMIALKKQDLLHKDTINKDLNLIKLFPGCKIGINKDAILICVFHENQATSNRHEECFLQFIPRKRILCQPTSWNRE